MEKLNSQSVYNRRAVLKKSVLLGAATLIGRFLPTGFDSVLAQTKTVSETALLNIDLLLAQPTGRVERPYVAVWVEDSKGNMVKTISLWVSKPELERTRWVNELRRWFKLNEARKADGKSNLVLSSSPTRNAGKYRLAWDCRNENKELLPVGDYVFLIETAREHGRYALLREEISFGANGFSKTIKGNVNIEGVSLEYRA